MCGTVNIHKAASVLGVEPFRLNSYREFFNLPCRIWNFIFMAHSVQMPEVDVGKNTSEEVFILT